MDNFARLRIESRMKWAPGSQLKQHVMMSNEVIGPDFARAWYRIHTVTKFIREVRRQPPAPTTSEYTALNSTPDPHVLGSL